MRAETAEAFPRQCQRQVALSKGKPDQALQA